MNKPITKVDMTPLVSVALILVIIFVVTSPIILAPADSEIHLPRAATDEAKLDKTVIISFDVDERIAIDETWVSKERVVSALKTALSQEPEKLVLIRADKKVRHKDILALLSMAKKAGAVRIALATEQRSRTL